MLRHGLQSVVLSPASLYLTTDAELRTADSDLFLNQLRRRTFGVAYGAGTGFTQERKSIDARVMTIRPTQADGIVAHQLGAGDLAAGERPGGQLQDVGVQDRQPSFLPTGRTRTVGA